MDASDTSSEIEEPQSYQFLMIRNDFDYLFIVWTNINIQPQHFSVRPVDPYKFASTASEYSIIAKTDAL